MHRTSSAHEEGGERVFSINTLQFTGENGKLTGLDTVEVEQIIDENGMRFEPVEGTEHHFKADMVLLAMGFVGPEKNELIDGLGVDLDQRGNVARDGHWMSSVDGVFGGRSVPQKLFRKKPSAASASRSSSSSSLISRN